MFFKKKIPRYIIDDIEISSDSDRENSEEKIVIKKLLMNKILMKKIPMKKIEKKNYIFFYI